MKSLTKKLTQIFFGSHTRMFHSTRNLIKSSFRSLCTQQQKHFSEENYETRELTSQT